VKLYLASSNPHKYEEISQIMANYNIPLAFHQTDLPELQSESLGEIALFSAKHGFAEIHSPLFTEDTGLFIETLNNFPGPYASFVYKTIGNEGILKLLEDHSIRTAIFKTAIALIISETEYVTVLGEVTGKIASNLQGLKGWGYDPIFIPDKGDGRTYGEMDISEKNQVSHRNRALSLLYQVIAKNYPQFIMK
jgi:XTP/dITP diphosphohydrolase